MDIETLSGELTGLRLGWVCIQLEADIRGFGSLFS